MEQSYEKYFEFDNDLSDDFKECQENEVLGSFGSVWPQKQTNFKPFLEVGISQVQNISKNAASLIESGFEVTNETTFQYIEQRKKQYELKNYIAALLPTNRIKVCNKYTLPTVTAVKIGRSEANKLRYSGLMSCGQFSCCPHCAAKIGTSRRQTTDEIIQEQLRQGKRIEFVTFTIEHEVNDDLINLKKIIQTSWRAMSIHRTYKNIGYKDYIKTIENTYGVNGFHPHIHILYFHYYTDKQIESKRKQLFEIWASTVKKYSGRECSSLGFKATGFTKNDLAEYLNKLGFPDSNKKELKLIKSRHQAKKTKNFKFEIVATNTKKVGKTLNFWELVELSKQAEGDDLEKIKDVLNRYVQGTKGLHWFETSKNVRIKPIETDEEILKSNSDIIEVLFALDLAVWYNIVIVYKLELKVLNALQMGGYNAVYELLIKFFKKLQQNNKKFVNLQLDFVNYEFELYGKTGKYIHSITHVKKRKNEQKTAQKSIEKKDNKGFEKIN